MTICTTTGLHYNPHHTLHGGPMDAVRHVGDLGNIRCDSNGEVDAEITYTKVSLVGPYGIIGRSLVVRWSWQIFFYRHKMIQRFISDPCAS